MTKVLQVLNKALPYHDYRLALTRIAGFNFEYTMPANSLLYPNHVLIDIDLFGGFDVKREIKSLLRLLSCLFANRYDILHWYSSKYYLVGPVIGYLTGHRFNIITINGLGRVFVEEKYSYVRPVFLLLLRISSYLSKQILVQNADDALYLRSILPKRICSRIRLVYSGLDRLPMRKLNPPLTPLKVVNVSRIERSKGISDFLEIVRSLNIHDNKPFKFTLIGESSGDQILDDQIDDLHGQGYITYVPKTSDPFPYLEGADIFLFTSYREGLPRVLIEACSCGLPIFAYNVPGVKEVVINEVNGYLFPSGDYNSLINKLHDMPYQLDKLYTLGIGSSDLFAENFTIDKYLDNMRHLYNESLEGLFDA